MSNQPYKPEYPIEGAASNRRSGAATSARAAGTAARARRPSYPPEPEQAPPSPYSRPRGPVEYPTGSGVRAAASGPSYNQDRMALICTMWRTRIRHAAWPWVFWPSSGVGWRLRRSICLLPADSTGIMGSARPRGRTWRWTRSAGWACV